MGLLRYNPQNLSGKFSDKPIGCTFRAGLGCGDRPCGSCSMRACSDTRGLGGLGSLAFRAGSGYAQPGNGYGWSLQDLPEDRLNPETIARMSEAAISQAHDPEVAFVARAIVRDVDSKDYVGELRAIYNWVKTNVKYRLDPYWVEWVQSPKVTLGLEVVTLPSGLKSTLTSFQEDCDGHATLIACLCMAIGHGAAFETVCANPKAPEIPIHVYGVGGVRQPGGGVAVWYPLDTTMKSKGFGWRPRSPQAWNHKLYILAEP